MQYTQNDGVWMRKKKLFYILICKIRKNAHTLKKIAAEWYTGYSAKDKFQLISQDHIEMRYLKGDAALGWLFLDKTIFSVKITED